MDHTYLPCPLLADKPRSNGNGLAGLVDAEAFDMGVHSDPLRLSGGLDLFDLKHV